MQRTARGAVAVYSGECYLLMGLVVNSLGLGPIKMDLGLKSEHANPLLNCVLLFVYRAWPFQKGSSRVFVWVVQLQPA